jgi:hypothetical protein
VLGLEEVGSQKASNDVLIRCLEERAERPLSALACATEDRRDLQLLLRLPRASQ